MDPAPVEPTPPSAVRRQASLPELVGYFLRLGLTAFGGPAAHVAMMEHEVVQRRGWLSHAEFVDLLGAANLIPGPNSTEMAIYLGQRQAGWLGLLIGGVCFILPAAVIVTALAWAYVRFGGLPQIEALFSGIKPVVIAIILQALWRLGRTVLKSPLAIGVAVAAVVLSICRVDALLILAGAGMAMAVGRWLTAGRHRPLALLGLLGPAAGAPAAAAAAPAVAAFGLWPLFLFFLKVGAILFGSGYVLLAFLRTDLVQHWHWLTEGQLLDAVAVGQFTPGPIFTTATFIGYLKASESGPAMGLAGAAVATVGIFLPAFFFVAVSGPLIPRVRRSPLAGSLLDGVNIGSLALMAVVTWELGAAALVRQGRPDWPAAIIAAASAAVLFRYRVNATWLIVAGAIMGLARVFLFH